MSDMSSMPTASRTVRCSSAWIANEALRPHACPRSGCGRGANHSGYSQPDDTAKRAPASARRSWMTDRRTFRAEVGCQVGNAASPNRAPNCSTVRSLRNRRLVSKTWVRSTLSPVMSTGGTPSTIHCAVRLPTPPLSRIPREFMPAATKYPRSSGDSPRCGEWSDVKLSGPQNIVRTPASCRDGKRSMAFERYGPIRSQSVGRLANATSAAIPSSDHGPATGSNSPTRMPPPSSR